VVATTRGNAYWNDGDVYLSLVIPVHNGADRLPGALQTVADWLCRASVLSELVLVDDGSEPRTAAVLRAFAAGTAGVRLIVNDRNRGKGYAVARGMSAAVGCFRVFTDADLAYPIEEVERILAALETGVDIAIACRVLPDSRYVISPSFFPYLYTRHVMSRTFNWAVRHTLLPGLLDTQAGLKGFSARAAERVFRNLRVTGFGFDVELLYVARRLGLSIVQTPVRFRYESEPSTLHFTRDAVTMLGDLARIRWNGLRGRYR
jgi:dolichyl-phosphate beta-glucosyltransferase